MNKIWNLIYCWFEFVRPKASRPLFKRAHCAPLLFCDLFSLRKEIYPRPTALVKTKIHLGLVFLITSGSSKPEPREKYFLGFVAKNKATDPISFKNMSSTGFGTINILAEPSLPRVLRFQLLSPIIEILRFQSLPCQSSESPFVELKSRFPLRSSYIDRDAPSPEPCFTYHPESPAEEPSLRLPLLEVSYREMLRLQSLSLKVPRKRAALHTSLTGLLWREMLFLQELIFHISLSS